MITFTVEQIRFITMSSRPDAGAAKENGAGRRLCYLLHESVREGCEIRYFIWRSIERGVPQRLWQGVRGGIFKGVGKSSSRQAVGRAQMSSRSMLVELGFNLLVFSGGAWD